MAKYRFLVDFPHTEWKNGDVHDCPVLMSDCVFGEMNHAIMRHIGVIQVVQDTREETLDEAPNQLNGEATGISSPATKPESCCCFSYKRGYSMCSCNCHGTP